MCVCVSHVAYPYPALAIPLTFLLIPNKKMTDKIITDDGDEIPDDSEDKALLSPYETQVDTYGTQAPHATRR